jgi:hypothetical protein
MAVEIEVRKVQVAELRRSFRALLSMEGPIVVSRNSTPCAVVLRLYGVRWGGLDKVRAQRRRLLAELQAALASLLR